MCLKAVIKVEIMSMDVEYVATFKETGGAITKIRSSCCHFSMCLL